ARREGIGLVRLGRANAVFSRCAGPAAFNASHRRNVPLRRRVVGASARPRGPGRGMAYASNTLGAIAGAVLAGFVLVPALGVHASIKLGVVINLYRATAFCRTTSR